MGGGSDLKRLSGNQNLLLGMVSGCGSKLINYPLLVWKNVVPGTTKIHPESLHAGRPVTKGEKYAFNLWFRENKFV